ncbi:glutaredoxin family protein [Salirhabdus sp. Marseille-P4669]|uniref:glutaredoxin family protein n=1 Tax=Salirhabdus sp. Marseille-P4669 TaxID=2042310 RepID=UPI000C799299|nr:glutaredoxin family protein [Salirhabdus sp. Marseille-P4669]
MNKVILYTKERCPLCVEAKELLHLFQDVYDFSIEEVDIYQDDELLEKYQLTIPVIEIGGELLDASTIDYLNVENLLQKKY